MQSLLSFWSSKLAGPARSMATSWFTSAAALVTPSVEWLFRSMASGNGRVLSCVYVSEADEFIKTPLSSVDISLLDWDCRRHTVTHGCLHARRRHWAQALWWRLSL